MAEYPRVNSELRQLFGISQQELEDYGQLIESACESVFSLLDAEPNDGAMRRLEHLCAVKAFYLIELLRSDGVKSFSAGDISYTSDGVPAGIKILLEQAQAACSDIIGGAFVFKAV